MTTKRVVIMATVAAVYAAATILLLPVSFGPLQFRAANLLMPLMFFAPEYAFGLALGCFFGNIASPFGPLDWVIMPLITLGAALLAYRLRRWWIVGIVVWAVLTAAGVAFFPLGIGAQIPFIATFPFILIAQLIAGFVGYGMWTPLRKLMVLRGMR